jgi:hypothetical protein
VSDGITPNAMEADLSLSVNRSNGKLALFLKAKLSASVPKLTPKIEQFFSLNS